MVVAVPRIQSGIYEQLGSFRDIRWTRVGNRIGFKSRPRHQQSLHIMGSWEITGNLVRVKDQPIVQVKYVTTLHKDVGGRHGMRGTLVPLTRRILGFVDFAHRHTIEEV